MLTLDELRAKLDKRDALATHLPGFLKDSEIPTWEDFINHVDETANRPNPNSRVNNPLKQRSINSTIQTGLFYLMSEINDKDEAKFFSALKPVEDLLQQAFPDRRVQMSSAFFNLISGDADAPKHRDNTTDNFFVNCRGEVLWKLFRNREDLIPETEIRLGPGDAIFLTRDVYHEVSAPKPRASIIFRIDIPKNEIIPDDRELRNAASAKNEERPASTTLQEKD